LRIILFIREHVSGKTMKDIILKRIKMNTIWLESRTVDEMLFSTSITISFYNNNTILLISVKSEINKINIITMEDSP
jgi:hypothetical protein